MGQSGGTAIPAIPGEARWIPARPALAQAHRLPANPALASRLGHREPTHLEQATPLAQ